MSWRLLNPAVRNAEGMHVDITPMPRELSSAGPRGCGCIHRNSAIGVGEPSMSCLGSARAVVPSVDTPVCCPDWSGRPVTPVAHAGAERRLPL